MFGEKLFYLIDISSPIFPKDLNTLFTTLQFYLNYYAILIKMLLANDEQHAHLDFKVIKNILHKLKILYTKFTCQEIGTIAWPLSA